MAIKTPLHHLSDWYAAVAETQRRLRVATEYRDKQIALRDRKASQISLAPHEERMWQKRIDAAQKVVDTLSQELERLNR
jgi:hypothetical protein